MPLTAVIIASNAGRTIKDCIEALHFCDEIIVGENGSTDNTVELAKKAGATVKTVSWQGYGKTKNRLIDTIKQGWILSVDADEVASPELADEIVALLSGEPSFNSYFISRKNYFLGSEISHAGWAPDWQLRLFKSGAGRFEEKEVHEALAVEGGKGYLKKKLNHYSYPDLKDYFERLNRYTTLAARDRRKKGKTFSLLRLLFDPGWTFFKMYIIKRGVADGFAGLVLCLLSSYNTLVKHAKHWEFERKK